MNAERWQKAKEIFSSALDLPEGERERFIAASCGDDADLRQMVEQMILDDRGADRAAFLAEPLPAFKDLLLTHERRGPAAPASSSASSSSPASDSSRSSSPRSSPSGGDATTVTTTPSSGRFTLGQVLGNRYRIVRLLGRGGMGEVWQAYDLKLQVDVALKSIRPERFLGEQGQELLRREVRTAREVISPNVCRIFDLVEEEGQEFVSMEYIDGRTLLDILLERGPLELQEATRIASQFLSGLEAIHQAGLVHRDVKPENIMVTRTGRVVLMDFGIAKGIADDRRGTIAGTPAYMAPEQLRGERLDARADIFAAGVVLAEMCAPGGIKEDTSRGAIWKAVRETPVKLFESPWRGVLERAVSSEPSRRYESARALARALEEVTLRVEGAEDKHPYPGLESFTTADAEFFFGREVEVEAVWKKLQRANLLAIIGPSGAGKTSFLQAGLLPAEPVGWRHVVLRPGSSPFVALGHALVAELAGDADAMRELVEIERPEHALAAATRWRSRYDHVLIVVDQCEELFTLCRPDAQASFADLLGRLAAEADVHVILAMRDDFLFRCHEYAGLAPIFSELTPLGPPAGSALRRALVQPALLCGYRFEDESLADEMLAAIEGERGALPMLAFTAARLWENRDRERGLLTREAYQRISGVSGALAQHAEATLERIGAERQPIVREIFRNLVTAQNTRSIADVGELLSVFPDRDAASEVLSALINARLLTSFELPAAREDGRTQRRVEIVHESLLSHWPRLVRWQTQDTEGAQLRDQLRQAAQLWKERQESEDLLWTGTAFKEFELWRERYPGGLTATEEAYARAMVERAGRQRRRRRRIIAGTFAALALVAVAMTAFGIRAQVAQRRSEASKLRALGRNELEADPGSALAYAIKSLEIDDGPVGRRFALEALSRGPTAHWVRLPGAVFRASFLSFSPDGNRLAVGGEGGVQILSRDGSSAIALEAYRAGVSTREPQFGPDGDQVVFRSGGDFSLIRVWSLSAGKEIRRFKLEGVTLPVVRNGRLFLVTDATGRMKDPGTLLPAGSENLAFHAQWTQALVRTWAFDDKEPRIVGRWNLQGVTSFDIDPNGGWAAYTKGNGVYISPITDLATGHDRLIGEHPHKASRVAFDAKGDRLASADSSGGVLLWSSRGTVGKVSRTITAGNPVWGLWFDPSGARIAVSSGPWPTKSISLWELDGGFEAEPVILHSRSDVVYAAMAFDPSGRLLASAHTDEIAFWPIAPPNPYVLDIRSAGAYACFTPDGKSLLASSGDGLIQTWGLDGSAARRVHEAGRLKQSFMKVDPLGRFVAVATVGDGVVLVSLPDGEERRLPDTSRVVPTMHDITVSADGRIIVSNAIPRGGIRVWDLESNSYRVLESSKGRDFWTLALSSDGRIFAGDKEGNVWEFNIRNDTCALTTRMSLPLVSWLVVTRDSRFLFVGAQTGQELSNTARSELIRYDLEKHISIPITTHGNRLTAVGLDPAEKFLVTRDMDGIVRVGPITGEEPHMLFGTRVQDNPVTVDPSGTWIATGGPTVLLWRMPEGRPFHTLPHDEFLDRLRAKTNICVATDPTSSTGYRLDRLAFQGWKTLANQ